MKLLVCGKGGSGKSAITILLANRLRERGTVYVLDADESNRLLPRALGVEAPDTIGNYMGGRKNIRDGLKEHENIVLSELPEKYLKRNTDGVYLAVVGKIEEYGEGCACPYGFLSKELLKRISMGEDEFLLVDAEAGVEHLGRSVEDGIDKLLVVVDPTAEAVAIAVMLKKEADRIGKPLGVVVNKVTSDVEPVIVGKLLEVGLKPVAVVRHDPEIFRESLAGAPIKGSTADGDLDALFRALL